MQTHPSPSTVFALFLLPAAEADSISVTPLVSGSSGAYTYSYEVDSGTTAGILLFSLTVTGDVGNIQSPTGWISATGVGGLGETLVEWISTDVPYDVPALGDLSGFSFSSDWTRGSILFNV